MKNNKKKKYGLNFILLMASISLCFLLTEIFWRMVVLGDTVIFKNQKEPLLYADPYSENVYWKMRAQWYDKVELAEIRKRKGPDIPKPDHELFVRNIYRDTYKHVNAKYVNGRRPVLLYGDSFSACYSKDDCFDHLLNNDEDFSKNHYLLNYGVGGYGLDQIYLLIKNSIDNYYNPFVIVGIMTMDLDRSILSFQAGPKPFFTIENDRLNLHEKPFYPDMDTMFEDNKPQIISYFYKRVIHSNAINKLMPNQLVEFLKRENYYKKKKIELNERILSEIIKELDGRNIDYIFLIFHQKWLHGEGSPKENVDDWRDLLIRRILDQNNISSIWAKDIIMQNRKAENLSFFDYYIKDGHPNGRQRKLLVKEIKAYILKPELKIIRDK